MCTINQNCVYTCSIPFNDRLAFNNKQKRQNLLLENGQFKKDNLNKKATNSNISMLECPFLSFS